MAITLDDITLPDDLIWIDEYAHTPVRQTVSTAVNGSLIVEAAAQTKGRPISLAGGPDYGWMQRSILELLRAKQYQPGLTLTLTLHGTAYSVLFVQPDGIEAAPVVDYNTPDASDWYVVTLKFIEV
jgi:hypothetical protein